jgi:flagellar basal-body rod modification protein FlgD
LYEREVKMDVSSVGNANVDKEAFLRLFTTQLKNQSPLDPLKGHDFIAQLAQFSSLEQLTNLNTSFSGVLESQKELKEDFSTALSGLTKTQQIFSGGDLIGKKVEYTDPDSPEDVSEGKIEKVSLNNDNVSVVIDEKEIPISNIRGILQ